MIKDLFVNMTILISFISIGSQLIKNFHHVENSNIHGKLITGILLGILGCLLMLFSLKISNMLIDFRSIAISMSAIYGGPLPLVITAIILIIFRTAYYGVNSTSLMGVALIIVNSLGCWYISKCKIKPLQKWIYASAYTLFATTVTLSILLINRSDFYIIILTYWVSFSIISTITYWYIDFSLTANKLFLRLKSESTKDFLTGLNNVREFDHIFNSALVNVNDKGENLSLLMVDIDFFKKVNDTYGHKEGDAVLKELGMILSENCRRFDVVSRNGGEEFSILLPDCPYQRALQIAERIREAVEAHSFILTTGVQINITVSVGVASYPETVKEADKLLEKADTALYAAKRSGRNRVCS